jgi:uncharacterized protein
MSKTVVFLSLGTLLFFGITGILIIEYFHQQDFMKVLHSGENLIVQILAGSVFGGVSALIGMFIITRDFFKDEHKYYYNKINSLILTHPGIILISISAGIGEEIFFRAALQPLLGLWITSILFVALHGYINPKNWKITLYGIAMVFIIAGFGYLFIELGLISAIIAHGLYDYILLNKIYHKKQNNL